VAKKKRDGSPDNLTGSEKAAVFLLTLGEEFTSEVFKRLDHDEIKSVGRQMSKMDKVDKEDIAALLSEFRSDEGGDEIYLSGDDMLETALKKALNSGEASDILNDIRYIPNKCQFSALLQVLARIFRFPE